jgi:pSer/pThr/pTyr-binding forkhead associated (FHA) protein
MASIIVMSGTQNEFYLLRERVYVIGRSEELPIQILDEYVSRKHLRIRFDKEKEYYYAIDMKSRNGVFVKGRKINDETLLADGDQIHIGDTDMLFTLKDFPGRENALNQFKKAGERKFSTS